MTDDVHLRPAANAGHHAPEYSLRALGRGNLPERLQVGQASYKLIRTIKHDFWAVTGIYVDDAGAKAVLKMGRTEPYAGMPLEWVGRFLCRREVRFYERLRDLPNIPPILGRVGTTGFLHAYVEGQPLSKDRPVPRDFFDQFQQLMAELHRRDIAYVDANKPQNILLGDDGRPHLIDFQISWDLFELGDTGLNRWWLHRLQRADIYHLLKHKRRMRPEEMSAEERLIVENRGAMIKLHRLITRPYFKLRRKTFQRLRASGRLLPEGSK